jgi:hypothetical protein
MNNPIKTALFSALMLVVLPSNGQTCNSAITQSTPTSQFTLNSDGTVTDNKTELTWMRCSLGQTWNENDSNCTGSASRYTLQDALTAATSTSFAGKNSWRLPNIKELKSIAEQACYNPAINISVFPSPPEADHPNAPPESVYWSSSPHAGSDSYAWVVHIGHGGGQGNYRFSSDQYYVRLVRSGQ